MVLTFGPEFSIMLTSLAGLHAVQSSANGSFEYRRKEKLQLKNYLKALKLRMNWPQTLFTPTAVPKETALYSGRCLFVVSLGFLTIDMSAANSEALQYSEKWNSSTLTRKWLTVFYSTSTSPKNSVALDPARSKAKRMGYRDNVRRVLPSLDNLVLSSHMAKAAQPPLLEQEADERASYMEGLCDAGPGSSDALHK